MVQITKSGKLKKVLRYWPFYVMALPGLIYLFINNYIPMTGLILAFERYDVRKGIYGSPKCGLENFQFLFNTSDAWMITRNTILYNVVFILLGNICAILVANCLNEIKENFKKNISNDYSVPIHYIDYRCGLFGQCFFGGRYRLYQ